MVVLKKLAPLRLSAFLIAGVFGFLLILSSCTKDAVNNIEPTENEINEQEKFDFEKKVKVYDETGKYFISVNLQTNDQNRISDFIESEPYLGFTSIDEINSLSNERHTVEKSSVDIIQLNKEAESNILNIIYTDEQNIPEDVFYGIEYRNSNRDLVSLNSRSTCRPREGNREGANHKSSIAKSVYSKNNGGCIAQVYFYSKNWWRYYKYRYYVSLLNNDYTFKTSEFNKYKGIKVKVTAVKHGASSVVVRFSN